MQIGKLVILPSSFTGSDRCYATALPGFYGLGKGCREAGFTHHFYGEPKWKEITIQLRSGQSYMDRPDVVVRVFRANLKLMIYLLKTGELFGDCRALVYTIKYQKRTLPHVHILLCIENRHAFTEPRQIDNIIRAELPDQALDPDGSLTEIVKKVMIHGPCET
jgi:hypothetical protein